MIKLHIDDVIREAARRGDIQHLTLGPTGDGKKFQAAFKNTDRMAKGYSIGVQEDPCDAVLEAVLGPKWMGKRQRREAAAEVDDIL